ncbi:Protein kinase domain containing protein [Aphelenchoides avenae]|nr:Protein kinase domain containing protein [Aphelenchus avenae]
MRLFRKTAVGTIIYMAPEQAKAMRLRHGNIHGAPVDVWALGIILSILLTGIYPVKDDTALEEIEKNAQVLINITSNLAKRHIVPSAECKLFLQDCLRMKPANRPSAGDLLASDFVKLADKEAWTKVL